MLYEPLVVSYSGCFVLKGVSGVSGRASGQYAITKFTAEGFIISSTEQVHSKQYTVLQREHTPGV